jgi:chemotaxis response regulator CheB
MSRILSEIEKTQPDVVMMELGFYGKIDRVEIFRMICSQFGVPVMYT